MRQVGKRILVCALLSGSILAGTASAQARTTLSPAAYFHRALAFLRAKAVYVPAGGWPAVIARADEMATGQTAAAGTYAAIDYVLQQLAAAGDRHVGFMTRAGWTQFVASFPTSTRPNVRVLAHGIGYISLPGTAAAPNSAAARRYAATALRAIVAIERRSHPCGWVVNLRRDAGGDMYPMLFAISPLLPLGRVVGFAARSGRLVWATYSSGVLTQDGVAVHAPLTAPSTTAPTAVLLGPQTVSAGEATAIGLVGRPDTASFGLPTAGLTGSPAQMTMPDGAVVRVTAAFDVDRTGRVYKAPVTPDVPTAPGFGSAMRAAEAWLRTSASCAPAS